MTKDLNHAREPWKAFQVRQRNLDEKRDAVLLSAAHLFLERGYRQASMSELARLLKITKPALYYYFRNKEEILVACYKAGITVIETLLDGAATHGTGLDKIRAYVEAYTTAVVMHDFGRCVAMLDDAELSTRTRQQVRNLKRKIDATMRAYIEEGIADGSIAVPDAKIASFAMAGAINWIGIWYKPGGPLSASEIASQFATLFVDGLRTRAAVPVRQQNSAR